MNTTELTLVTKGNGVAIHIAHVWTPQGAVLTKCDTWGAHSGSTRPSTAAAPTCKRCIRSHERSTQHR